MLQIIVRVFLDTCILDIYIYIFFVGALDQCGSRQKSSAGTPDSEKTTGKSKTLLNKIFE